MYISGTDEYTYVLSCVNMIIHIYIYICMYVTIDYITSLSVYTYMYVHTSIQDTCAYWLYDHASSKIPGLTADNYAKVLQRHRNYSLCRKINQVSDPLLYKYRHSWHPPPPLPSFVSPPKP